MAGETAIEAALRGSQSARRWAWRPATDASLSPSTWSRGEILALDGLAGEASGTPRLGDRYAPLFRLTTGIEEPVDAVLARVEADLGRKRIEVAEYGRGVWKEIFPNTEPPHDDLDLVGRLFDRVARDRAPSIDAFVEQYKTLVAEATAFVREKGIITLPEPLTVLVDRSPSYFVGQAVGGVYPAGPYAPDADALLFLPTPPEGLSEDELAAFFRDFNDHFNRMITPHEIVPGHYLQLKLAAHHPRTVRALFADGVRGGLGHVLRAPPA